MCGTTRCPVGIYHATLALSGLKTLWELNHIAGIKDKDDVCTLCHPVFAKYGAYARTAALTYDNSSRSKQQAGERNEEYKARVVSIGSTSVNINLDGLQGRRRGDLENQMTNIFRGWEN